LNGDTIEKFIKIKKREYIVKKEENNTMFHVKHKKEILIKQNSCNI